MSTLNTHVPVKVPGLLLLSIYSLWFFLFGLIFVDMIYLSSSLSNIMNLYMNELFFILFAVLQVPHVLLSYVGFGSFSYLKHYSFFLPIFIPLMILGGILYFVPSFAGFSFFYIYYFLLSNYHFVMQHIGINKGLAQNSSKYYTVLIVIAIIFVQMTFFYTLFKEYLASFRLIYEILVMLLLVAYFFVSCYLSLKSKTKIGKYYLHANTLMYISFIFYGILDYPVLMLISLRVIHDVTATVFYLSHAKSYARSKDDNIFLNFFNSLKLPIVSSILFFTLSITTVLYFLSNSFPIIQTIIWFLVLAHFLFENVTWRSSSPHRKEILF